MELTHHFEELLQVAWEHLDNDPSEASEAFLRGVLQAAYALNQGSKFWYETCIKELEFRVEGHKETGKFTPS